jgi:hypothetical protein
LPPHKKIPYKSATQPQMHKQRKPKQKTLPLNIVRHQQKRRPLLKVLFFLPGMKKELYKGVDVARFPGCIPASK